MQTEVLHVTGMTCGGCTSNVTRVLKAIPGVGAVSVNLVWTPLWNPDRIEPRVRAYMGL